MHFSIFTLPVSLLLLQFSGLTTAQSSSHSTTGNVSVTVSGASTSKSSVNATSATPTSSANFPSLSGYSSCVSNCLTLSISAGNCTSVVDVNCFCFGASSKNFTKEMVSCVAGQCFNQLSSAEALAEQFCALANTSTSLSFASTTPPPSTSSPSSASTTSTPSTTSTTSSQPSHSSNAAARGGFVTLEGSGGLGLMVSMGVGFVALVVGTLCV